jgi:hypothetical protein
MMTLEERDRKARETVAFIHGAFVGFAATAVPAIILIFSLTRDGHHDEAKGGCGNILQACKYDPTQAPREWSDQLPQPK